MHHWHHNVRGRFAKMDPDVKRARFWALVDKSGDCWLWMGLRNRYGYGRRGGFAHRMAYEELVGPIPDGLQIDHLCRNRACVNPAHMEPVTSAENSRRGIQPRSLLTHCKHGHEFTPENTYYRVSTARGRRDCRRCTANRVAAYVKRKKVPHDPGEPDARA